MVEAGVQFAFSISMVTMCAFPSIIDSLENTESVHGACELERLFQSGK